MKRRRPLSAALTAAVAVAVFSGCGVLTGSGSDDNEAPRAQASPRPTPPGSTGIGSVTDHDDLPDPCTLLTESDVAGLTARDVSTTDTDGAEPGATTRYCQWQQPSGQLDVFLSRTTEEDFRTTTADAQPVDGVGQDAAALSGHLYVLHGSVQIDVYSRGDSDEQNLEVEKRVAQALIPKL